MSRDFILLVALSIVIALPIGYFLMQGWLDGFAYHITLGPGYFIVAGAFMLAVAWITVMIQISRSVNINTSESLRGDN